jgi:hypothetical protein
VAPHVSDVTKDGSIKREKQESRCAGSGRGNKGVYHWTCGFQAMKDHIVVLYFLNILRYCCYNVEFVHLLGEGMYHFQVFAFMFWDG